MIKNELQNIISGKGEVRYGTLIQTILGYLAGSKGASETNQQDKYFKKEETKKLISLIETKNLWYKSINFSAFVSEGAEQKVFLKNESEVIKLNDSIYYASWKDYFINLLLNNYFFPDTAYELLGFFEEKEVLYAVVRQNFVKSNKQQI